MSGDAPGAPEGRSGGGRVLRRLVPLALVGLGVLLWRSPLLPQPITLVWDRPFGPETLSAEVQLWRGDTLVARVEWPDATQGTLSQQLTLRPGPVRALSFVRLRDGSERRGDQVLELGREEVVHAPLVPGGR
jgi:hypothetical protein